MPDPLTLTQIVDLTQKPDLTKDEILQVLTSKIVQNDNLENIRLFNEWRLKYHNKHTRYNKTLTFNGLELRNIDLTGVNFKNVKFIECNFFSCKLVEANCSDAVFTKVWFWGAHVSSTNFQGAEFEDTKLDDIESNGDLNFTETRFVQSRLSIRLLENVHFDFTNSIFRNTIITIPTGIRAGDLSIINPIGVGRGEILDEVRITELNLDQCHLQNSKLINLTILSFSAQYASFDKCEFINSKVEDSQDITGIIMNNVRMSSDFFAVFYNNSTYLHYKECLTIYDNFNKIGDSSNRNKYYLHSRNLLGGNYHKEFLESKWENRNKLVKYFINRLHKYFWNYGESPFRILFWSGLQIIFIAVLVSLGELSKPTVGFFDALYLSAITFATVGYGDIVPGGFGRILLSFEGLLGPVMVTLFIVSLTKKMLD